MKLKIHVVDETGDLVASRFESRETRFRIEAGSNRASGDTGEFSAEATVNAAAAADHSYLIYHFLDAMAYPLITAAHLTPMHAGCVAREGRGVLLCGDSQSGKSSLAYACARAGWTFVSDDASPVLRREADARTVLGGPHRLRLRPDARELFRELARFDVAMRGNGKVSLQIPTRELPIVTAARTRADAVVLLHRRSGETKLRTIEKTLVREHCEKWFYHWNAWAYKEQVAAFDRFMSGARAYALEYSDLAEAVKILDDCV